MDIVNVLVNVDVKLDFMVKIVNIVCHCLVVSMAPVEFHLNVFARKDGMVYFVLNVS